MIRRLKRICAFYGSHPTFICASATIAQPARAGRAAPRGGRHHARRPQRRAARRAAADLLQPAARQPRDGHPAQLAARGAGASPRRGSRRGRADHRVLPQPPPGRGDAQLPAPGRSRHGSTSPERCAATAPATCRCTGARSRPACAPARCTGVVEHQRAGARHRHRHPPGGGARRLPGHDRLDVAAARPCGPPLGI